jgi:hypothetical protein
MGIRIGRLSSLTALGIGLATAAAVSLSTAGSALADATDGTGTATVNISTKFLSHLAKWGIIVLPESSASSSDKAGVDAFTFAVTGGDGTDTNFSGTISLGGGLTFIDASTGQAVHFTSLVIDYLDDDISGVPEGSATAVPIADFSGNFSVDNAPGTETFSASQLTLDPAGASFLNKTLKSTSVGKRNGKTYAAFVPGTTTVGRNAFTATYVVTIV